MHTDHGDIQTPIFMPVGTVGTVGNQDSWVNQVMVSTFRGNDKAFKGATITYHAGLSILHGMEHCNFCTIGVEFQGNTLETPLTGAQIASAIEYLLPIMEEYQIPLDNIVTHEMVRNAYREQYPDKPCDIKVDITSVEYDHFMQMLHAFFVIRKRVSDL